MAARIVAELGDVDTALGEAEVFRLLTEKAVDVAGDDADRVACYSAVARQVARRMASSGAWDERVEDDVPPELQPLHMSAVREALGALIPEALHKSMDKAAQKMKDDLGVMRGGSVSFMDGWRVNVRAEDALARGRLQEDAMEFFLLVLKQVCKVLSLPIAIGSKTVGKEVGRQENAGKLARVMENWRQVWARDQVRAKEALVLPVALDERTVPQDWVCVVVRSITAGEKLGDAKQLLLRVYDPAKRVSASRKLA